MRLVRRLVVGFGILDTLAFAALVFCATGTSSFAAALVCDLVLRINAVCGTLLYMDTIFCLRLTTFLGWTGRCAVVGRTLGSGVCTLRVGV